MAIAPAVANVNLNAILPPVAVNLNALVPGDALRASKRRKLTERAYEITGTATAAEVEEAIIFEHTVVNHAAGGGVGAVAPAWAAPLLVQVANITAQVANITSRHSNQKARVANNGGLTVLSPLAKITAGHHPSLNAWHAARDLFPPGFGGPVPPSIGDFPPPGIFPATELALNGLSQNQIRALQLFYNDDFGIIAGDLVNVQRQKFSDWII